MAGLSPPRKRLPLPAPHCTLCPALLSQTITTLISNRHREYHNASGSRSEFRRIEAVPNEPTRNRDELMDMYHKPNQDLTPAFGDKAKTYQAPGDLYQKPTTTKQSLTALSARTRFE
ncbi:hypothetical protein GGR57DRAFT_506071 [Xylariaceae sp. FL1272]|nr:hypothetical protein GGR57DRAFT_506071 [Xylariaceae sp. FL1272]